MNGYGYHKFVNDHAQRKFCRVHKRSACLSDKKCDWNDAMWLCNEAGYQPNVQTCDEVCNPIPINDKFYLGNCTIPSKSPYENEWKVVFEIEDDNNSDEVPDDPNVAIKGFKTKNAYFVGAEELKSITYNVVQFCVGYRATSDGCPRVKCNDLPNSWIGTAFAANINAVGSSKPMSKAIACFAVGGYPNCGIFVKTKLTNSWKFPIGYADNPAPMDTYGNAKTGGFEGNP